MKQISYAGYRFPPEIIQQAIWLYLRFTLSVRDVEDMLAERGIGLSHPALGEQFRAADRRLAQTPAHAAHNLASR